MMVELYSMINKCFKRIKWSYELKKTKQYVKNKKNIVINNFDNYRRILIISAHADDELIGCYKLLEEKKSRIKLFYYGFLGSNASLVNQVTRRLEFEKFCKHMGIYHYISSGLSEKDLHGVIKDYSPDLILIPSFLDWHKDHRKSNFLLKDALDKVELDIRIGLYKISIPIPSTLINSFIRMTKIDQLNKWALFKRYYKSQINIPIDRFKIEERLYGKVYGGYAVEIYSIMDVNNWSKAIEVIKQPRFEWKLNCLEYLVDNIYTKFKIVSLISEEIVKYLE